MRKLVIPAEIITWLEQELVTSDARKQAKREQALRRYKSELNRLGTRLDILYEDRLDGRIDAGTYDTKARTIREDQQRLRTKITECQSAALPPAGHAIDLMSLTSQAAALFTDQSADEKRRLLRLVLDQATWQAGELRMSFRQPFEQLQVSNSASATNGRRFEGAEAISDIWR